jgi:glutamate-1-semialdehyde 2,1-aminomutase
MRNHQKSIELYARAQKHLAGGVSSNVRYASVPVPLFFTKGEGARLYDVDGNTHIDFVLGNGPAILGHAPAKVIEAVSSSLAEGQVFAGQHRREIELAERLSALLPSSEVVRFASSGTEAVLMAMRLARAYTKRDKILKFEGHYHGWSDQAFISVRPPLNEAGPSNDPVAVAGSPGIPASALGDVAVCGWNDLDLLAQTFSRYPGEIAAVIMEPMMVNGGVISPSEGYLEGVQEICRANGALLIFDEVITGFRVGLRGAQGKIGVKADLTVYAKAVAAGFPMALVGGRTDIMQTLQHGGVMHGGTYNGNVQSMAAALATLDVLAADDGALYGDLEARGLELMAGIANLAEKYGLPILVQGDPAIFQTYFTTGAAPQNYRESAACDADAARSFHAALQEEGVRIQQAGKWFLSAAHDRSVIAETLLGVERAMAKLGRH